MAGAEYAGPTKGWLSATATSVVIASCLVRNKFSDNLVLLAIGGFLMQFTVQGARSDGYFSAAIFPVLSLNYILLLPAT
jgi:hypothetical protein